MKKLVAFLILIFCLTGIANASVDTIYVYSNAMHRSVKTIIVKPTNYSAETRFPVVYLLHGAFGNATNWIMKVPMIEDIANQYQMLIVCPDGAPNSWYVDSPTDSSFRFETHIGIELPAYIDAHYKTIANRKYRAIAGLSMGGFGAFFIAFRHADTFGACGSMSGAFDLSEIKAGYDLGKRLGDTIKNVRYYNDWSITKVIEKYPADSLAIIFDCGQQDFIAGMSRAVHEKMVKLKIPHDYIERPGRHDWFYWANAVKYELLFFRDFFERAPGDK